MPYWSPGEIIHPFQRGAALCGGQTLRSHLGAGIVSLPCSGISQGKQRGRAHDATILFVWFYTRGDKYNLNGFGGWDSPRVPSWYCENNPASQEISEHIVHRFRVRECVCVCVCVRVCACVPCSQAVLGPMHCSTVAVMRRLMPVMADKV